MWNRIKTFFLDSEAIFLARLQVLAGIVWTVIGQTDPHIFTAIIGAKWFGVFLFVWGILSEYARRRRDPDLGKQDHVDESKIRGV